MQSTSLEGGFTDPARDASHAFRAVMGVMAQPGTVAELRGAQPPLPMSPAAGAVVLTLCDPDTPLYLGGAHDTPEIRDWVAFHTGAPLAGPEACMFALGQWQALLPLSAYPVGTPEYPDRSATLIVDGADLSAPGVTLRGPGIKDTAALALPDPALLRANAALYPLGLDFFLTEGDRVAALPRSTEIL